MAPKRVLAVRHGESEWNYLRRQQTDPAERYNMYLPDSGLTKTGVQQSKLASEELKLEDLDNQDFVLVVSPLRRALLTARHMLTSSKQPLRIEINKDCAEVMRDSCDIGSTPLELEKEFPEFDFSRLEPENWWPYARSREETWEKMRQGNESGLETEEMVLERLQRFRTHLRSIEDDVVVVVCHSEYIWWLTSKVREMERFGVWTKNGEVLDITEHVLPTDKQVGE